MKYPFAVFQTQVEEHIFWVAKSTALKGCVGQGETADEALQELEANEKDWLDTAKELGITVPSVPVEPVQEFSGKLTLRVASSVHRKAATLAKKEGVSLNQYINDAIVSRNSELSTATYISKEVLKVTALISGNFERNSSNSASQGVYKFDFRSAQSQKLVPTN